MYMDDIVVYSQAFEQHLRDLDKVLGLLQNAGIMLRVKKAHIRY